MDESALRELLDRATESEPPIGPVACNAIRAGLRLRRRRRAAGAGAFSAVAVVLAGTLPAVTGAVLSPATPRHRHTGETAYVVVAGRASLKNAQHPTPSSVVPVHVATGRPGRPIALPGGTSTAIGGSVAVAAPRGMVYVLNSQSVSPVSTVTDTARRPISLSRDLNPFDVAITPDGKTIYAGGAGGLVPIDTGTDTALRGIKDAATLKIAITPDGATAYVVNWGVAGPGVVTPVRTAGNTAGKRIRLRLPANGGGFADSIAITPDGKTVYVVDGVQEGKPYANSVSPISTATNIAGNAIRLKASGLADGIVIAPDGRTAYVLSSRAVTPINIATSTAGTPISLPASAGYASVMTMTPDGRTIYVLTPRAAVPVSTATGSAGAPIVIKGGVALGYVIATSPDGGTVYVGGYDGLIPISTATNTAGAPIRLPGSAAKGTVVGIVFTR